MNMPLCNVLIIDDDQDDIEFLVDALCDCHVDRVHSVLNAKDAFAFIQSIQQQDDLPKIIITDLNLPGMSGDEFIGLIKTMRLFKHIPVIVFSTSIPESELERYSGMEAVGFMKKPNNYSEYLEVAKILKNKVAA
jgi:CheY-like chemotaxis protein